MALRYGKCTNFGLCSKADIKALQRIPDGADFVCEECKKPLTPAGGGASGSAGNSAKAAGLIIGAVVLISVLGAGGYFAYRAFAGKGKTASTSTGTPSVTPGPASAPSSGPEPMLRLSGSNTIGSNLGPALAEAWLTSDKGATNVRRESAATDETRVTGTVNGSPVAILIRAHGSSTAFTDLAAGSADIGMASRKITPAEVQDLKGRGLGDLTSNASEKVLGLDGVAVIVNEGNDTDTLRKDELADIFAGTSSGKEWHVYARDNKSGTYETFKTQVLGNRSLVGGAKRFEDSKALVSAVAGDPKGIGFVGLPYAVGVKKVAISEKGTSPLIPTLMTIRTESYPLTRRLYLYLPENAKPDARNFVTFALSAAGQDIVDKEGFVGQKVEKMTSTPPPATAPKEYQELAPSADRLSLDFRFRTGSSTLDTKAVDDINRLAGTLSREYSGRPVVLVGFADNTGSPAANLKLSKERAEAVAAQLKRQGVAEVAVTGLGQDMPVADNSTPEGREKNRRVEIWLRR